MYLQLERSTIEDSLPRSIMSLHGPEQKRTCQYTAIPSREADERTRSFCLCRSPLAWDSDKSPQEAPRLLRVAPRRFFPGSPPIPCPAWAVQSQIPMAAHGSSCAVGRVYWWAPLVACPAAAGDALPRALGHNSVRIFYAPHGACVRGSSRTIGPRARSVC